MNEEKLFPSDAVICENIGGCPYVENCLIFTRVIKDITTCRKMGGEQSKDWCKIPLKNIRSITIRDYETLMKRKQDAMPKGKNGRWENNKWIDF